MAQFKVLHFLDYFLPETMNWLEKLLQSSADQCQHILCFKYLDPKINVSFERIPFIGIKAETPLTFSNKLLSKVQILLFSNKIVQYIQNNDIDLLHFHFGNVAIEFESIILSKIKPSIISLYGYDYEYLVYRKPETKNLYSKFAEYGAHYIVEGHFSQQLLLSYQIPKGKIHILQMIFNRTGVVSSNHFGRPIRLIQVATYTEKKGQLILLQALLLCKNRNQFILEFYGEIGNLRYYNELVNFINTHALNNVKLNKKLTVDDYLITLGQAHIAVNLSMRSSVMDTEGGCPVFLKDALVLGKPIFTTYHCDIPDIGVNDYNGWLIREGDIQEAVSKLELIAHLSTNEYLQYSYHAKESVTCKLNINLTGNKLIDIYNRLLDANRFI